MWGAYDETNNKKTNWCWSSKEQEEHINVLELRACQLGLQSFYKDTINVHIKVYMDNTTSVSYINKYGGRIASLNAIARDIWLRCIQRNITLSACHVCGTDNNIADKLSRTGNEDLEWSFKQCIHGVTSFLSVINNGFICIKIKSQIIKICVSNAWP